MFDRNGGDGDVVFFKDDAFLDRIEVYLKVGEFFWYDIYVVEETFDSLDGIVTGVDVYGF